MADSANVAHDGAIDRSGTSTLPPSRIGAKAQDSLPTAVSGDGDCVDLVATRQGQLRVKVDSMPSVTTTGTITGDVTVVGKAADDAPVSGNPVLLAGRSDITAGATPGRSPVNQSGDVATLLTDEYGRLRTVADNAGLVNLLTADLDSGAGTQTGAIVGIAVPASGGAVAVSGTANGLQVNLRTASGTEVGAGANGIYAQGPAAHDAAIAGNPVLTGGYAHATGTLPSAVSGDGDAARLLVDRYGRARVSLEDSSGTVLPGDANNGLRVQLYGGAFPLAMGDATGLKVAGNAAQDEAATTYPVIIGGYAANTLPSAVSGDGDSVRFSSTRQGQLRTITDDNANAVGHSVKYEASHAGGSTEVTAKASAGLLKWIQVSNPNTTDVFLQLHDASNPTIGSATPLMSVCVPGGTGASNRGIYNQEFGPVGITFATALTYTVTTTAEGSTAPGSAVTVSIGYK